MGFGVKIEIYSDVLVRLVLGIWFEKINVVVVNLDRNLIF